MAAEVKAARVALQKAISAAADEARVCRNPGDCPHCDRAVAAAMHLADQYAYAAIEANEKSGGQP